MFIGISVGKPLDSEEPLCRRTIYPIDSFPNANPGVFIIKQLKIKHGIYKVALGNKK